MEDLLQVVLELFLQLIFELFADTIWRHLREPARAIIKWIAFVACAIVLGWISAQVVPTPLIASGALRVANLIVSPLLIAFAMHQIGFYFEKREAPRSGLEHFGLAWVFAFLFALTRYWLTR